MARPATHLSLLTGALLLAGCGRGPEAERFSVSGTVTFQGKPVPAGTIYFTPDASKQPGGAQGFAPIKDGHYDTKEGRNGGGGPVVVHIEGFTGVATPDRPLGQPLFLHDETADLPREAVTRDFEVPAEAGKNLPTGPPA